jgi:hypothetical protein
MASTRECAGAEGGVGPVKQILPILEFPVRQLCYSAVCSTYSRDDAWYPHTMAAALRSSAAPRSTGRAGYGAESIDRRCALIINRVDTYREES